MIPLYAIYRHPTDYPDQYVVRRFAIAAGSVVPEAKPTAVVDTLEEARVALPRGLVNLSRSDWDEPQIVEVWL